MVPGPGHFPSPRSRSAGAATSCAPTDPRRSPPNGEVGGRKQAFVPRLGFSKSADPFRMHSFYIKHGVEKKNRFVFLSPIPLCLIGLL